MSCRFNLVYLLFRELWRRQKKEKGEILHPDEECIPTASRAKIKEGRSNILPRAGRRDLEVSAISASTEIGSSIEKRKRTEPATRGDKSPPARAFDAVRLIAISRSLSLPNKEVAAILLAANASVWPFAIPCSYTLPSPRASHRAPAPAE